MRYEIIYADACLSVRVSEDPSQTQLSVTMSALLEAAALSDSRFSSTSQEPKVLSGVLKVTLCAMVKRRKSYESL